MWEWNEDVVIPGRGIRGGAFNASYQGSNLRASFRYWGFRPSLDDSTVGFRVVQVPEPCSAALLLVGTVGILRRRFCR